MIYLFGGGGHSGVIYDLITSLNLEIGGVFDDNEQYRCFPKGILKTLDDIDIAEDCLIISIGNNNTRATLASRFNNYKFSTLFHPSAVISTVTTIGDGTVVLAGAVINAHTVIGRHCILNNRSCVSHDCIVGDFVHIAPAATLCGDVQIGHGTFIGAGAVVIPGVRIGNNCTIGAGTIVRKSIPDNTTAVGNPARILKRHLSGK